MNVEIGTVTAQFLFWEYLLENFRYWFLAVQSTVHKRAAPKNGKQRDDLYSVVRFSSL
jgi:hypothetical protein